MEPVFAWVSTYGYGALFGRGLEDLELDRYTATARALFFKASYLLHF